MDLRHPVTITRGLIKRGLFTKFVGQAMMSGRLYANGDGAAVAARSCVVVKGGMVYEPLDNVSIYADLTGWHAGRDTKLTTRRRDPGDRGVFLTEDLTYSDDLASVGYEGAAYASETM
jgi:hypothetical protein